MKILNFCFALYRCGECGHRFINKNLLNIHNKAVHQVSLKAFQCQFCDYSSPTRAMIEAHQRRKHTKEKVILNLSIIYTALRP